MFTIGVGQCGVQVSGEFWSQVHREGAVNKVGPSLPSISGLPDGEGASSDPLFSKYCDDGRSLRAEESTQRPATRRTGDLFDQSGKARALFVDSEPKVGRFSILCVRFSVIHSNACVSGCGKLAGGCTTAVSSSFG
jgi:hypothetical protein